MSNAVAGWYDDGSGRQRWWDGSQWTNDFNDGAAKAEAQPEVAKDPNVLWEAVGKPITGIGAGRYRLTKDILYFEKGALSMKAQQIQTHEIHDVDAQQTMTQKARGVGTITLHANRVGGSEIVILEDLPNFREGVAAINAAAHDAREAHRVRQQTQHVSYQGAMPAMTAQAAPAPAAAPGGGLDLNVELAKLAAFRDQGVLDADEFKAAKAKLLGL